MEVTSASLTNSASKGTSSVAQSSSSADVDPAVPAPTTPHALSREKLEEFRRTFSKVYNHPFPSSRVATPKMLGRLQSAAQEKPLPRCDLTAFIKFASDYSVNFGTDKKVVKKVKKVKREKQ